MNSRPLFICLTTFALAFSGGLTAGETAFIHFEDLDRGINVTGLGTVHPNLNIETIHGTDNPLVVETGFGVDGSCDDPLSPSCVPFAYGAPNGLLIPNNCLEDEFGNRVELAFAPPAPGVLTAKGFSDVETIHSNTPQELKFTFAGRKVKSFSILITDFGDFNDGPDFHGDPNPGPKPFHQFGLWAFADPTADHHDTNWIASDVLSYWTELDVNPTTSWNPDYGNLQINGDGCAVSDATNMFPGHHHLMVQNDAGLGVVYLLAWQGADPHVAFDSIRMEFLPDTGDDGCTPGYWKTKPHQSDWLATGYSQSDSYSAIFGVTPGFSADMLLAVLRQGGGKEKALGRHAVAALLNATHPDVLYAYSEAEVIDIVQDAYASGHFNMAKGLLEVANEQGTPGFCE